MCCFLLLRSCDFQRYGHGRLVDSVPSLSQSPLFAWFRVSCFVADGNGGSLPWFAMLAIAESPESLELRWQRRSLTANLEKMVAA
ncbi:hypothetical protein EUGRSUZ_C01224 [Eucalyptus grandis]|uniref:Uncharacterized protein n=2 Tax=Eucalyptus grandis TaxID=71139 RepID=A0A059CN53_EUCGR|nr:hypothetical protein EUGRSUZ_C01224 [Eucalyptus grandis]